ncbi:hypothetical protein PENFLA_c008G04007 [Penicillium flavigenum]|uniref:Uncharacterized protein n=1 Tax=Penicillium flavigenum TaxID=254877 RepID=A0A1V6TGZ6_9EURO|nr:hypothetical protein PENFLA_c008G04007 [Penicillium flavigenum]
MFADYFACFKAFVEWLLATVNPTEGTAFLWALVAMYACVLAAWRVDALVEWWINMYALFPVVFLALFTAVFLAVFAALNMKLDTNRKYSHFPLPPAPARRPGDA